MSLISIVGAKTHNLKNINIDIPRNKLVVITGLSGSGKSSLAFNTLYAEGQRRYVESLSSYARQFLGLMDKPDVEHISGLSPAVSIQQKTSSYNPRSTVGTITEVYDYLRLLFSKVGEPQCPKHKMLLKAQTITQMIDKIAGLPADTKYMLVAPVVNARKGNHKNLLESFRSQGYIRAYIDGGIYELDDVPDLDLHKKHTIKIVVDRFKINADSLARMPESLESALSAADGVAELLAIDDPDFKPLLLSSKFACAKCGYSLGVLEPNLFSFNSPIGACSTCGGLGNQDFIDKDKVIFCKTLSLAAGAIKGWGRKNLYYYQLLGCLAKHYNFDLKDPFESLPAKIQDIILYGSKDEEIEFVYYASGKYKVKKKHPFEGVLAVMMNRYRTTDNASVLEDLKKYISCASCTDCGGARLCEASRNVFIAEKSLPEISDMSISDCYDFFNNIKLNKFDSKVAASILNEVKKRLGFLNDVGLNYLSLIRSANTLSGGESQRIKLASQIGSGLVGVMYVLDEPTIGLHQRDNSRLISALEGLRDLGNSVIVVEHDEEIMRRADFIIDIGPMSGVNGGEVVVSGSMQDILDHPKSLTGQFLSGKQAIIIPEKSEIDLKNSIAIKGACFNNLKKVDCNFPVGVITCVTGVSGSGKSTLVNKVLLNLAINHIANIKKVNTDLCSSFSGFGEIDYMLDINQSPIGRTPRSNPATYIGIFTPLRDLFAASALAKARGYSSGRFSFNVKGGRCEACQGAGVIKVEMHFLSDVYVKCDDCDGKRYNKETLEVLYKDKNIFEVLEMTVADAAVFFDAIPSVKRKLQTLIDVGLEYLTIGQRSNTLSGGEAQRIKLAKELSKRDTGNTLYILDEPTTGLHFYDINLLLKVLQTLKSKGNTIVIIEHNLDVIKTADWIVDLGPEGGSFGGELVVQGTPSEVMKSKKSYTGEYLNYIFN